MFIIMYFSFKFKFGNDPTVSAPDKGLCCKPTNIGENDIMYINISQHEKRHLSERNGGVK